MPPASFPPSSLGERGNPDAIAILCDEIGREEAITFARFMEVALYHPEVGYYQTPARRPGRGGDFITAPELHPFFGITIARQIAEMWQRLDRPDPFVVREYGPGVGGMAYDIIAGISMNAPELREVLRYRLRDVNRHRLAEAMSAMIEVGLDDVVSVEEPSRDNRIEPVTGVALANEVADALPAHQMIWTGDALEERWVVWNAATGWFEWETRPLSPAVQATDPMGWLARQGVDVASWPIGSQIAWVPALDNWVREISQGLARGYGLVIDYGYPASELYRDHRLEGTIRAYAGHTVSDDPFQHIAEQDLTVHVDFTRITGVAAENGMRSTPVVTQGDFLSQAGLGQLLVRLQQEPETDMAEYYRAQAAVLRLIEPAGLGRFRVVGLMKDVAEEAPLMGFAPVDLPDALRI
ncbi:MAG: class I SAM-dependent methyltransferase [Thermomicrobiales bacterium]